MKNNKKGGLKMYTIALITVSAIAIYFKIALWQHNKSVINGEEKE